MVRLKGKRERGKGRKYCFFIPFSLFKSLIPSTQSPYMAELFGSLAMMPTKFNLFKMSVA